MIVNATLCYLTRGNQTLMLRRCKKDRDIHFGKWNGLGGKLEPGESPEECAFREIYEESGLHAETIVLKGILTFPQFDNGNNDWIVFVYLVPDFSGSLIESDEGDLNWINNDELLTLPLWEGDRIFIPWLRKPGFFSGKFSYSNGKLMNHTAVFYR